MQSAYSGARLVLAFEEIWMVRSKRKVGKASGRSAGFDVDELDEETADEEEDVPAAAKGRRPRREMRERIEVRDEERLLTRELSDWDSYDEDLD